MQIDGLTAQFDRELADSVLEVSIQANRDIVNELKGDQRMCQALLEIMEPEINKIRVDDAIETAIKMLKSGKFSAEEIHDYIPRLSIEEIKMLRRG